MNLPVPTLEYWITAGLFTLATVVAVYMAGRHNQRHVDLAFVVRETEADVDQLDLIESLNQRDEALETVAKHNDRWLAQAVAAIAALNDNTYGTGEEFRILLLKQGLPAPAHSNAWGSLFMTLTRRKVLVPTGEYVPMKDVRSHGRKTPRYRKQTPQQDAA